jgi:hypothetical protein
MPETQTQQNNSTQTSTTSKPSFPMSDTPDLSGAGDVDFDVVFDDSGRLNIVPKKQSASAVPPNDTNEGGGETGSSVAPSDKSDTTPPSNFLEQQYKNKISELEGKLSQMSDLMASMYQNQNKPQEQTQDLSQLDFSDPKVAAQFIQDSIKKSIQEQIQPVQGNMQDIQLRLAYNNAVVKYGQDFQNKLSDVVGRMKNDVNLTFDNAYLQIKGEEALNNIKGQTNGQSNNQTKPNQLTAQQLADKAKMLSTDSTTGVSQATPNLKTPGQYNNLKEAFEAAYNEVYGMR